VSPTWSSSRPMLAGKVSPFSHGRPLAQGRGSVDRNRYGGHLKELLKLPLAQGHGSKLVIPAHSEFDCLSPVAQGRGSQPGSRGAPCRSY
jgi:hypothetical protein